MPPDPLIAIEKAEKEAKAAEKARKERKVIIPRVVDEEISIDQVEGRILKVEQDKADALIKIVEHDEKLIELTALLEKVNNKL